MLSEHVDAPLLGPPAQSMGAVWFAFGCLAFVLFGGGYIALSVVHGKFTVLETRLAFTNDKANRAVARSTRLQDRVIRQAETIEQLQTSAPEERTALLAMYQGINGQLSDTLDQIRARRIPVEKLHP